MLVDKPLGPTATQVMRRGSELHHQGDQEVPVNTRKKARTVADRLEKRQDRLAVLQDSDGHDVDKQVRMVLAGVLADGGRAPSTIKVRRPFVRLAASGTEPVSDRQRLGTEEKPPVARLISPRGIALRTALTMLFVAQCVQRRQNGRPVVNFPMIATASKPIGWTDLVTAVADKAPTSEYAMNRRGLRERQIKRAMDRLADSDVALVELPRSGTRRKYAEIQLNLDEGPRLVGSALRYEVPGPREKTLDVPVGFFLNGWIHALTDSEIATWLMFRDLQVEHGPGGPDGDGLHLSGQERLKFYGLSKDAWESHRMLGHFGLMTADWADGRREDGTYEDYDSNAAPPRHRFHLDDTPLQLPGLSTVNQGIAAAIASPPGA